MARRSFIKELERRNMLHDHTPGLEEHLQDGMCVGYIGFDPTAPSLTLGNYVQIMLLSLFQRCGHKPLVVMGGATGRIGDPSGKDKERVLKTIDELDANILAQSRQFHKFLNFEKGENAAVMVNNFDFYKNMNVLDFLRNVGKHTTINYMLSKESVKKRLETGISYTEFTYQLLQAYDFYCLYKDYGCKLQMGGSDQWGNIIAGTDYISKTIADGKAFAITTPLLTKSDGSKFGKSEEGNIWLDAELTSPYKFYQFWLNADDADLPKLFRYFSFKECEEIEQLESEYRDDPRRLKQILAAEITERIHGEAALQSVEKVSSLIFGKDSSTEFLHSLDIHDLSQVSKEIPSFHLRKSELANGIELTQLLTEFCPVFSSKSEVRRAVQSNALTINKYKISQIEHRVQVSDLLKEKFILIENGKKNKYILIIEN
ncbi:MAG: tyrosine--tRNA ligase [Saprospiraceae bacterium]|nr:tyrosine--tRNA ligase [Saprospiraceae bacterium]